MDGLYNELQKARERAAAIGIPVIVHLLDMAILELGRMMRPARHRRIIERGGVL